MKSLKEMPSEKLEAEETESESRPKMLDPAPTPSEHQKVVSRAMNEKATSRSQRGNDEGANITPNYVYYLP